MGSSASATRGGCTALEVMIAAAIFAAVIATLALATTTAAGAHKAGSARAELEARAHRVLDRLVRQLDEAGRASLQPDPVTPAFTPTLEFVAVDDFAGGAPVWGPRQRIQLRLDPAEIDNGLDDDGDGLVDEGQIAWTESPGEPDERETVWSHNVRALFQGETLNGEDDNGNGLADEPGLFFDVQGNVLRMGLTLEGVGADGRLITASAVTSVRLRN